MSDHDNFLLAMGATPDDMAVAIKYADWLDERGDPRAELLRLWAELRSIPYAEETYARIQNVADCYRAKLNHVDPNWLACVGRTRRWIDQELAEKLVRVYLRIRHGRKEDRQQVGFESMTFLHEDKWWMYYWRNPPSHKLSSCRGKSWLSVNRLSGEISGDFHF